MQTPGPAPGLLSPIGYRNNSCGYCHNKSGSFSYYSRTTQLSPQFYEALLNRGWRRSGTLLYKPDLRASCCPQYTVRLDSHAVHVSKDQRQAVNRFNKHILGDDYIKEAARLYPRSRDQAKQRNTEFDLLERIHESEKANLKTPPEPSHAFVVTLEPDTYTDEKYVVFENYQRLVHKEPPSRISKGGFKNFLCSSPLLRSQVTLDDGREQRLGSYHQCYRLDGKLVAVGVLDLLPNCVSAVYFMYHESIHQFQPGKLGALREIALAKEDGYRWWYAGFYIHTCIKMRYKGDYSPQYILDPETYHWDLLNDEVKKKLDKSKYLSLSAEGDAKPAQDLDIDENQVLEGQSKDSNEHVGDRDSEMASDSEDDDDPPVPDPDRPVFLRSMPGILNKEQLLGEVDLDHIKIRVRKFVAETSDLVSWNEDDLENPYSIKGMIAELAAVVGPELVKEMCIYF
ncbi:arginine-tRNA-protein transferase-like protein 1 [Xylogone sp. PMI_703]|nr:arginine-tRNA-protein transferase-like protein 1 [Xylogone sp. PMI_703]